METAVDFIRVYADRTHHGKEEDILFRAAAAKPLSDADRRIMNELIQEHIEGRRAVRTLAEANARVRRGEVAARSALVEQLGWLAAFYPAHIEKEDAVFFPALRAYFTDAEEQALLAEFRAFDGRMIHEKYRAVAEGRPL